MNINEVEKIASRWSETTLNKKSYSGGSKSDDRHLMMADIYWLYTDNLRLRTELNKIAKTANQLAE